jgi:hypothetical protein
MVQAAEPRHRHHVTVSGADQSLSASRSFFLQSEMSAVVVLVAHVLGKKPF